MVVWVALRFTVVTSLAAQSVVERPVSAAYSKQCIIALIVAIVVARLLASAVSVASVDIIVEIALTICCLWICSCSLAPVMTYDNLG